MYNQSAQWVSRRRRARPRRPAERGRGAAPRSRERVRLIQLGVCLALFLVVFVGRGASPSGRMAQLQQRLQTVLTADTDFRAAFSALGESLSGQGPILGELGEFCIQVFGAEGGLPEGAEDYAAGAAFQTEQDFLNRPAGPRSGRPTISAWSRSRRTGLVRRRTRPRRRCRRSRRPRLWGRSSCGRITQGPLCRRTTPWTRSLLGSSRR